jgi:hypothetical protein
MRRTVIATLVITALAAGACGTDSAEADAVDNARDNAKEISNAIYGTRLVKAGDIAHHVADLKGVEILNVSGATSSDSGGVRVVVRISGSSFRGEGLFQTSGPVTVARCFELTFDGRRIEWDTIPPQVRCPAGAPLTFGPWPKPPPIPIERIEHALPKVNELPSGRGVEERDVRAAIAKLNLDPAIRIEVKTESDFAAGIAFVVDPVFPGAPFDCILASVKPGETKAWVLSRTPGAKGCEADDALQSTRRPS